MEQEYPGPVQDGPTEHVEHVEAVEHVEHADGTERPVPVPISDDDAAPYAPASHHEGGCGCGCGCGDGQGAAREAAAPHYVYALGQIDFRLPSLSVEKEIAQTVGRSRSGGLTDREAVVRAVTQPENRYIARQLCYVLSVQGIETYLLRPRDSGDFALLVDALRPEPGDADLDLVIGLRGPLAPPDLCNGLTLPVVGFDQIYSFDSRELIASIDRPESLPADRFEPASQELLRRVIQIGDNAGDSDEHRALNYLAVRYPRIYEKAVEEFADESSLSAVEFRDSRLSGARRIVDVLFSYTSRRTDVTEKFFVRVDVTGQFPFLVNRLSAYYDR